MADLKYNAHKVQVGKGLMDLSDQTKMKIMLVTAAYVASATVSDSIATVNAGQIASGGGYSAGGKTLSDVTVTQDGTKAKCDAGDQTWLASTITAGGAVVWFDDLTDYPIALFDFGGDKVSSNGDFTVSFDANGILTID